MVNTVAASRQPTDGLQAIGMPRIRISLVRRDLREISRVSPQSEEREARAGHDEGMRSEPGKVLRVHVVQSHGRHDDGVESKPELLWQWVEVSSVVGRRRL